MGGKLWKGKMGRGSAEEQGGIPMPTKNVL